MSDFDGLLLEANLIGGKWSGADTGDTIPVTNPATGEVLGSVPNAGADETNRAIAAASEAFKSWSTTDLGQRVGLLHKLHDALMDNQEALAQLLTAEQGKPLAEARGEIAIGAAYVRWFAEEIRRAKGEIVPSPTGDRRLLVTRHPVGVVGAITPWNFPSSMLARKLGPALAAGCTVVAKPATATPYSGLVWGKLCQDVGFSGWCREHRDRIGPGDCWGHHGQQGCSQGHLHRFDRSGQGADPAVGGYGQEGLDGVGGQRALPGV